MHKETLIKSSLQSSLTQSPSNDPVSPSRARQPLPSIQTYCKSKTFIANSGVNPLVAAASALFSLLHKLRHAQRCPDLNKTHQALTHEIKAFECAAQSRGYRTDEILITRYIICATLDEIIQCTPWGKEHHWQQEHSLLYAFQGESWGGERFFLILEKLREAPNLHVDLMEFAYMCISLGFQGRYRHSPSGRDDLDHVIDALYHDIREQREEQYQQKSTKTYRLFTKIPKALATPIPIWLVAAITFALIGSLYLGFNYVLKLSAQPVYQNLTKITQTDDTIKEKTQAKE